jgi:hypothetical protein
MMVTGGKADPNAYIIAASIFAVAGAITTAAQIIRDGRNKKE